MRTIPEKFRSSPDNNSKYLSVRKQLLPILRSKAHLASIAGYIDRADLLQEMEVVALYGVSVYDESKGTLMAWVSTLAHRTVGQFLRYGATESRSCPRCYFEGGEWRAVRGAAASLDTVTAERRERTEEGLRPRFPESLIVESAEDYWLSRECDLAAQAARASFRERVDERLDGFARDLFWARINAPIELLIFMRNKVGYLPERPEQMPLRTIAEFYDVGFAEAETAWLQVLRVVEEESVVLAEAA